MVFKLMWSIWFVTSFGLAYNAEVNDSEEDYFNRSAPKKLMRDNITFFVSYPNNVFGPSIKIESGLPSNLTKMVYVKRYALKTPDLTETKLNQSSVYTEGSKWPGPFENQRTKRHVLNLYNMIGCATRGCNAISYKGYGCYCGLLGAGNPMDGIDSCCKSHDLCYSTTKCAGPLEYFVPYYWKCTNSHPTCARSHGRFGGPNSCASWLCECDRVLAECLRQYPCPKYRKVCRNSLYWPIQKILHPWRKRNVH